MKVVSIINYKGGVGKTTITSNLATGLAQRGKKVLLIDLDPQSNLTFSFINIDEWQQNYSEHKTIRNWFKEDTQISKFKDLIIEPKKLNKSNLGLICSHIGLIGTDLELASKMNGSTKTEQKNNYLKVHNMLINGIKQLKKEKYDVILIDCPPSFSMATRNALVASDYYIVPVKLDYLSTLGLTELKKHIDELRHDYNDNIDDKNKYINAEFLGVILNMVSWQGDKLISSEQDCLRDLKQSNTIIFNTMLRENKTMYFNAPRENVPAIMQKISGNTYKTVREELNNLVGEFIQKVGL